MALKSDNVSNSSRAPGSLSDRWSSLATIYPLRFHEIFGRWLSYNIKRVFQQKCSVLTNFLSLPVTKRNISAEKRVLYNKLRLKRCLFLTNHICYHYIIAFVNFVAFSLVNNKQAWQMKSQSNVSSVISNMIIAISESYDTSLHQTSQYFWVVAMDNINVSLIMEFLTFGYKIGFILSKIWMGNGLHCLNWHSMGPTKKGHNFRKLSASKFNVSRT